MKEDIKAFSQSHAEPEWLADLRQKSFDQIQELEMPHIERVRFNSWKLDNTELSESELNGSVATFTEIPDYPMLVQVGTNTVLEQISPELADKGVVFTDFYSALEEIPGVIEKYFASAISPEEDRLTAAHYAAFNSGTVLYVPDNVELDVPVEGLFYQDASEAVNFNKHVLIIAGRNSKLNYLERLETQIAQDEEAVKITAKVFVEVIALDGAQVKFSAIDRLGANVTAFVSRRGWIGNDATIDWSIAVMNDGNVICDFDSDLKGNGSHAELKAVGISMGKQIQGIDTRVTNFGRNSIGHILQHGVILEKGTLTFNGIGHIINGAKGADAQQESRVLMLSDSARADANPILLIDENDVTAGHAASIGQVDPEDMYYLMSRGLDEQTAKKLVIRGFLGSVIVNIPVKSVRDEFVATIDRKLGL
ncbi:MAG: Fe-S cluster assembly protein SufD [Streptococcaceae bacterium]|jgi:Fe-S cluster assembly protein SufD|nr:Fe-S cluster assembly protein SufD [Streptococcaceae bacterium]